MTRVFQIPEEQSSHRPEVVSGDLVRTGEVLKVGGPAGLTAANCDPYRQQVRAALNGHTVIEIDLSQTSFMDCAGLGSLIALRKSARDRNAVMRLINLTPAVRRLFEIVDATPLFEIVPPTTGYDEFQQVTGVRQLDGFNDSCGEHPISIAMFAGVSSPA